MKKDYNPQPIFTLIAAKLEKAVEDKNWEAVREVISELKTIGS